MSMARVVLAFGVLLAAVLPARAQRLTGEGTGFTSVAIFLQNDGVKKELKVTPEQMDQFQKMGEALRDQYQGKFQKTAEIKDLQKRRDRVQELIREASQDADKVLSVVLSPDQLKRLRQIALQQSGTEALSRPDIQDKLSLTDGQKDQLRVIREEAAQAMRDIYHSTNGNSEEARARLAALHRDTLARCQALLTPEQKKVWEELTGEPFDYRYELNRPVGPRPQPGNGPKKSGS